MPANNFNKTNYSIIKKITELLQSIILLNLISNKLPRYVILRRKMFNLFEIYELIISYLLIHLTNKVQQTLFNYYKLIINTISNTFIAKLAIVNLNGFERLLLHFVNFIYRNEVHLKFKNKKPNQMPLSFLLINQINLRYD